MNYRLMASVIDQYIADHENDTGGQTFMENNALAMHLLNCVQAILRDYADEEDKRGSTP